MDTVVMRLYERAPPPYVLRVLRHGGPVKEGDSLEILLALIGQAERTAPFALRAFEEAASAGFGRDRIKFSLTRVQTSDGADALNQAGRLIARSLRIEPPPTPDRPVAITFLSPLRLQSSGALMSVERFSAAAFLMAAVRRIGLLAQFYGQPLDVDFKSLKLEAQRVRLVSSRIAWQEVSRYSSRQKQALQMGGLVGEVTIDLGEAPGLWPFLHAAAAVGVGKATTMGLGAIALATSVS